MTPELDLDTDIDTLIGLAVSEGVRLQPSRHNLPGNLRTWTPEETAYLQRWAGLKPDGDIAQALNRSKNAVKVRRVRAMLPSRHAHPDYVSASIAAKMLGLDEHKLCAWIDSGLLEGEIYRKQNPTGRRPASGELQRRVRLLTLKRWITRPKNWIYFIVPNTTNFLDNFTRIQDPALRSLVLRAISIWGDEWWTSRQLTDYHHLPDPRWVGMKLNRGEIPGLQAHNLGGRHPDAVWSYWFIRKSDAIKARFIHGKGTAQRTRAAEITWSPRADAWILKARASKMQFKDIAARMGPKWNTKRVAYRYKLLTDLSPSPVSASAANGEELVLQLRPGVGQ